MLNRAPKNSKLNWLVGDLIRLVFVTTQVLRPFPASPGVVSMDGRGDSIPDDILSISLFPLRKVGLLLWILWEKAACFLFP